MFRRIGLIVAAFAALMLVVAPAAAQYDQQQQQQHKKKKDTNPAPQPAPVAPAPAPAAKAPQGGGACIPSGFARLSRNCSTDTGGCQRMPEQCNRGWCCP